MKEKRKTGSVEDMMNSLDGMQPAHAPDFLFNKIEQKIALPFVGTRVIPMSRVSLAAASILLLLTINILVLSKKQDTRVAAPDTMQQIVNEYGLNMEVIGR